MTQIEWRTFQRGDATALAALFRDAVMQLTGACYDTAARLAWASAADEADAFAARLARGLSLVAMQGDGFVAFGQLYPASHVEMLYVAPRAAGQGLAATLLARLEAQARVAGAAALTAEVSLCAAHCFARAGFHVLGEEVVARDGVSLRRFRMQKPLDAAPPRR
jgi:putative acetyltransferase